MPLTQAMYEGRVALIDETLQAVFGKPKDEGRKSDDGVPLVSVKNGTGTLAVMQSIKARAAAFFKEGTPLDKLAPPQSPAG